jgi:hypothetical protein
MILALFPDCPFPAPRGFGRHVLMPDSGALMIGTNLNGGQLALADLTGTTYTPTGQPEDDIELARGH